MQLATGSLWGSLTLPRTRRNIRALVMQRPWLRVLGWWSVHLAVLATYASLRGKMDDLGAPVHGSSIETGIFGSLPTLWLQRHIFTLAPHEFEWTAVVIHASWFFVPLVAGIFVSFRRPDRIGSFIRWWIALQLLALLLFAAFPMRPPWMDNSQVVRVVALRFGGEIDDPNQLAAMPSLHVTFPLLIGLWFVRERWKLPAVLMLAYSALIAFEVVFSGEHYVVDVLGAVALASGIALASRVDFARALTASSPARLAGVFDIRAPLVSAARRIRDLARRRPRIQAALWWAASLLFLVTYSLLRNDMDNVGFPVHGAELETTLFGSLPTVWLQHHLYEQAPGLTEWAAVVVHASWFVIPMLAALFVTIRRIGRIGSFFCWWIALQALVLPIYALLPLEPPWMANHEVIRIVAIPHGGSIPDANPLAALPSLHVAFPLTISLWFFRERWKLPAIVMLAYSSIVAFEVVFSGEHYVVDVLAACATAGFIYFAARIDYAGAFRSLGRAAGTVLARPVGQPALAAARSVDERERGQTLIEFAFALPIILLILLVLVDFGIALDHRIVMQHAVSEGVREAAVSDNVSDIVNTTVDQSQGLVSAGDVTVCYEDVDGNGDPGDVGDKVRVSASYTYTFSAGGGELMQAFGVTPPAITMSPSYTTALQSPVTGATPC